MRNFGIVSVAAILVAAAIASSSQAVAGSRGMHDARASSPSMARVTRTPAGSPVRVVRDHRAKPVIRDHRAAPVVRDHRTAPVIRDHRATATPKKVIRAGRNYDKTPGRKQVIVNGKRVPRKTG
jgi:hypothetical protein